MERTFLQQGGKQRETEWINQGSGAAMRRITLADREFHESGTLVRERRRTPAENGAELHLDQRWYLNGQPRDKNEFIAVEGRGGRRETRYHDNGQLSHEGVFVRDRGVQQTVGVHKTYDSSGRLRGEKYCDSRGRVSRERELDESGNVKRDDELFEDGSRKAYSQ